MKSRLLAAAAVTAMAVTTPAIADDDDDGMSSLEVDLRYSNEIETELETEVEYEKDVSLEGEVELIGTIEVDSSAVAVTDAKQFLTGVAVTYREENFLSGDNGFVDLDGSIFGFDSNGDLIAIGYFAPIVNTLDVVDIDGSGNIGVNVAAGYFNMQMNSATLASSSDSNPDAFGGWAEASTTSAQSLLGVTHTKSSDVMPEDETVGNNFRDRNTINGANVTGDGNIGLNLAAGALNQQSNLMSLAVATDADLAEATAGLIQSAALSGVEQQNSVNYVTGLAITGASGNVGVNAAAGVGNQQLNALTIAASSGGAAPTDPGGDPGDPGTP